MRLVKFLYLLPLLLSAACSDEDIPDPEPVYPSAETVALTLEGRIWVPAGLPEFYNGEGKRCPDPDYPATLPACEAYGFEGDVIAEYTVHESSPVFCIDRYKYSYDESTGWLGKGDDAHYILIESVSENEVTVRDSFGCLQQGWNGSFEHFDWDGAPVDEGSYRVRRWRPASGSDLSRLEELYFMSRDFF